MGDVADKIYNSLRHMSADERTEYANFFKGVLGRMLNRKEINNAEYDEEVTKINTVVLECEHPPKFQINQTVLTCDGKRGNIAGREYGAVTWHYGVAIENDNSPTNFTIHVYGEGEISEAIDDGKK